MLTFQKDTIFVGYGRRLHCSHCNNMMREHIYQKHSSNGIYWFQYRNFYGDLLCVCPFCEHGFKLNKKETEKLSALMAEGQSQTKSYFEKHLSRQQQRLFIKRLDKLKQRDLIVLLS